MKRVLPLCALAAACAAPAASPSGYTYPVGGPLVEVRKTFTCPQPPSRGLLSIGRDGKAERVVFEGLDPELGQTKFTRDVMTLAPKDAAELFKIVADSGWKKMPEDADASGLKDCPDCCSGALMIKTAEGGRSLRYAGVRRPPKLDALMKAIDAVLSRGTWVKAPYDWENRTP